MTLKEMILKFDAVPYKFEYPTGEQFEMFIRRKTNNNGYIVTIWEMHGEVQSNIVWHAGGKSIDEAKENLKKKILKS